MVSQILVSTTLWLVVLTLNYYAYTLAIWFGHWFAHVRWSPLRNFHLLGHHRFYPNSCRLTSDKFIWGHGKENSNVALSPWMLLVCAIQYFTLPDTVFVVTTIHALLLITTVGLVHNQFHLNATPLNRFRWFRRARTEHAVHHDLNRNFMVADHFWDRIWGTYQNPKTIFNRSKYRAIYSHGLRACPPVQPEKNEARSY